MVPLYNEYNQSFTIHEENTFRCVSQSKVNQLPPAVDGQSCKSSKLLLAQLAIIIMLDYVLEIRHSYSRKVDFPRLVTASNSSWAADLPILPPVAPSLWFIRRLYTKSTPTRRQSIIPSRPNKDLSTRFFVGESLSEKFRSKLLELSSLIHSEIFIAAPVGNGRFSFARTKH
jgi:hypothetical protein